MDTNHSQEQYRFHQAQAPVVFVLAKINNLDTRLGSSRIQSIGNPVDPNHATSAH